MDRATIQSIASEHGINMILSEDPLAYLADREEFELWDDMAPTTHAQVCLIMGRGCIVHREIHESTAEPILHGICHFIVGLDEVDVIEFEISLLETLDPQQSGWVERALRSGIPSWEIESDKISSFMNREASHVLRGAINEESQP